MKFSVVSVVVIGLLNLSVISAAPVEQSDSKEKDSADKFIRPLFDNIKGVLKLMETGQKIPISTHNQQTKYANSHFTIAEPIPDKDGKTNTAPSFLATALQNILKGFIAKDPELSRLAAAAADPNLIKYIKNMFDEDDVTDLIKLAMKSPGLRKLYSDITSELPLFGHLKDVIERVSTQDRVLGEVLSGHTPSLNDMKAVADNDMHYSINKLMDAIKQDKLFQSFLTLTVDKHPDEHDALKLLTGKDLKLDGNLDPKYQSKYSVSSSDISKNKELVNLGTAVLFGAENFSPLMKLAGEFGKSRPRLSTIVSEVFKMNTSMLKANNNQK